MGPRRAVGRAVWPAALVAATLSTAECSGVAAGGASGPGTTTTPGARAGPAAAQYLAIAVEGNRRLDIDVDALTGRDRGDVPASRADLRDAAATERRFDRALLRIDLPPAAEVVAIALVAVNEARAALTSEAATSTSPAQLDGFERRLTAADASVEAAVRVIRRQLGLPPPDTG